MSKNKYYNVQCGNCGVNGHIYKNCNQPILSYGIIGYRKFKQRKNKMLKNNMFNQLDCNNDYFNIKYLLICRKDSLSYCDFLRGRYDIEDSTMITRFLTDMTINERKNIETYDFDTLWNNLWINTNNKSYHNDYLDSNIKFNTLKMVMKRIMLNILYKIILIIHLLNGLLLNGVSQKVAVILKNLILIVLFANLKKKLVCQMMILLLIPKIHIKKSLKVIMIKCTDMFIILLKLHLLKSLLSILIILIKSAKLVKLDIIHLMMLLHYLIVKIIMNDVKFSMKLMNYLLK